MLMDTGTGTQTGRDTNKDTDRYTHIDMDMDPAYIYSNGSKTPWKFVSRGMIPQRMV
jgi:hypothetical protein